ncbi:MAG: hypothetical protein WA421_08940, partial [Nitrososphaeraceae archaeon]
MYYSLAFIVLSPLIFVIIFTSTISAGYSVQGAILTTNSMEVHSEALGNNGYNFKSFVGCPDHTLRYFDGGSHLSLLASISNIKKSNNASGLWQIEYKDSMTPYHQTVKGIFSSGIVDRNGYALFGRETVDDVCSGPLSKVTIMGECGDNNPIYSK